MVNSRQQWIAVLLLAAGVLTAASWLRGAEYDEQYTLFVTAGTPRPVWPRHAITAADVVAMQSGVSTPAAIARDLRQTDVHPPLYFWAAALWRPLTGGGLFATRLLSVGFSLGALALIGVISGRVGVPPALAMLLTLGCYGFAYTGIVARGFALAELLLLAGIATTLAARSAVRGTLGGILLGAATFSNYLAAFVAAAFIFGSAVTPGRQRALIVGLVAGFALALPGDAWFFLAQRGSRIGQFEPFDLWHSLDRLATFGAASVLGGLPLYVPAPFRTLASGASAGLAVGSALLVAARWQHLGRPATRHLLLAGAFGPPLGLLVLGIAFDNTPIELRYLAFATPFVGMLLAGAIGSLRPWLAVTTAVTVLSVQALALTGLMTRQETMQPARATARAASALSGDGIVLLPFGNDGVGIVGAFARESPPAQKLMIIRHDDSPDTVSDRVRPYRRVTLALLAQDADSRSTVAWLPGIFRAPCWRQVAEGFNVAAYQRICDGGQDVFRGIHTREDRGAGWGDPAAPWRVGAATGAAARQSADPCDVAPGRTDPRGTLHGDLPGPAGLRLFPETAGDTGPCALREEGDGEGRDRGDGLFRP